MALMPGLADQTSASPTVAAQQQAHPRLVDFDLEPEHVTQECGGGRQFAHFQIRPTAQELGHRRILAAVRALRWHGDDRTHG